MSTKHDEDCMCEGETPKKESVLKKSIYDKSLKSPSEMAKNQKQNQEPKSVVSKCSSIQPFKLEDMEVGKVLVEYRIKGQQTKSSNAPRIVSKKPLTAPKRLEPCEALKFAGFQPDWTKEKVAKMLQTPDGTSLLQKVDAEYRQLTGKSALGEKDIISCYPNYLKKERRNVELLVELDGDENILSVSEKGSKASSKVKASKASKASNKVKSSKEIKASKEIKNTTNKSKFNLI
jgi:hypothetical protein